MKRSLPVALAAVLIGGAHAAEVVVLNGLHVDVRITDSPAAEPRLGLVLRDADSSTIHATTNAVLHVPASTRLELPAGFEDLGPEGAPLWVLPQSQEPAVLFLGVSAGGIAPGTFTGPFQLQLVRVEGPGHFLLWQFDAFGNLNLRMSSRNGITDADRITPSAGGHEHFNWGFTATGVHDVYLRVSNRPAGGNTPVESDEIRIRFGVEPYTLVTEAEPALLGVPSIVNGRLRVPVTGTPGRTYPIESSPDLVAWNPAGQVLLDAGGKGVAETDATANAVFVRARRP